MVSVARPEVRRHEVIEDVWLGDEGSDGPYTFTAAPVGTVLSAYLLADGENAWLTVRQAKVDWLREGFDDDTWVHIEERLLDPADWWNPDAMDNLHDALVAEVAARPFTSSSASTRTRSRSTGAAKPRAKGATTG